MSLLSSQLTRIAAQRWVEKGEKNGGIGERDFEDALDTYTPTSTNARGYQRNVDNFESANGDGGVGGVMNNMANAFSDFTNGMWGGADSGDGGIRNEIINGEEKGKKNEEEALEEDSDDDIGVDSDDGEDSSDISGFRESSGEDEI